MYFCCISQTYDEVSDGTTLRDNYQENLFTDVYETENQYLQLVGEENYSLTIKSSQNIFPKEESSSQSFPLELLSIVFDKSKYIREINNIFIPYSKDLKLFSHLIENNHSKQIYTLDNKYLHFPTNYKQIKQISKEWTSRFDLTIIDCFNNDIERILKNIHQINQLSNNQVFIFKYCTKPNRIISQIMENLQTQREELMLISIGGQQSYYLFFYGLLTSTKNYSRFYTIKNLLLEDIQCRAQYNVLVHKLLEYILGIGISFSKIAQIIGKIKLKYEEELKKQFSKSLLQIFLNQIINEKPVDYKIVQRIFKDFLIQDQNSSTLILNIDQISHTIKNITQDQANSYNKKYSNEFTNKKKSNSTIDLCKQSN
ncbi:unnamed protein product [Paramecium sonneborni]|uniref:Uncharacterized protein n=1 Tax=Paramecium sonneborni TaxID=65129 RepID=A0A8S1M056_9CILI|nr:unnamed protein product [Paramecium sonneborni]